MHLCTDSFFTITHMHVSRIFVLITQVGRHFDTKYVYMPVRAIPFSTVTRGGDLKIIRNAGVGGIK